MNRLTQRTFALAVGAALTLLAGCTPTPAAPAKVEPSAATSPSVTPSPTAESKPPGPIENTNPDPAPADDPPTSYELSTGIELQPTGMNAWEFNKSTDGDMLFMLQMTLGQPSWTGPLECEPANDYRSAYMWQGLRADFNKTGGQFRSWWLRPALGVPEVTTLPFGLTPATTFGELKGKFPGAQPSPLFGDDTGQWVVEGSGVSFLFETEPGSPPADGDQPMIIWAGDVITC